MGRTLGAVFTPRRQEKPVHPDHLEPPQKSCAQDTVIEIESLSKADE